MLSRILFLGAPGAGKGTQAKKIAKSTTLVHLSSGDALRDERKSGSDLGKEIGIKIDAGKYVSDKLIFAMMRKRIESAKNGGFVLDGIPRTVSQIEMLARITSLNRVIVIDISRKESVRRLLNRLNCEKCGAIHSKLILGQDAKTCPLCGGRLFQRDDELDRKVVEGRFDTYVLSTVPMIDCYQGIGLISRVNGEQPIEKVFQDIMAILGA
ncbi:MAG: nucleoside monophosphate kinase [Candidatus Paceibacterota bacterium]|jgi:adenylate kinase